MPLRPLVLPALALLLLTPVAEAQAPETPAAETPLPPTRPDTPATGPEEADAPPEQPAEAAGEMPADGAAPEAAATADETPPAPPVLDPEYQAIADAFRDGIGIAERELALFETAAAALHSLPAVTQFDLDSIEIRIRELESDARADAGRAEALRAEAAALSDEHERLSDVFRDRAQLITGLAQIYASLGGRLYGGDVPVPLPEAPEPPLP
jgi:hypothetical protein